MAKEKKPSKKPASKKTAVSKAVKSAKVKDSPKQAKANMVMAEVKATKSTKVAKVKDMTVKKIKGLKAVAEAIKQNTTSAVSSVTEEHPQVSLKSTLLESSNGKSGKRKSEESKETVDFDKIDKSQLTEEQLKWLDYYNKFSTEIASDYKISGQYSSKSPINHKTFGWGYIISNEYDRLEVLFKEGKKTLISNRKL